MPEALRTHAACERRFDARRGRVAATPRPPRGSSVVAARRQGEHGSSLVAATRAAADRLVAAAPPRPRRPRGAPCVGAAIHQLAERVGSVGARPRRLVLDVVHDEPIRREHLRVRAPSQQSCPSLRSAAATPPLQRRRRNVDAPRSRSSRDRCVRCVRAVFHSTRASFRAAAALATAPRTSLRRLARPREQCCRAVASTRGEK